MPYRKHLSKDLKLKPVVKKIGALELNKRKQVCFLLCSSILSQQLSTKVADVFRKRFLGLYGGKIPTPQQIIETPFETLRSIGLSNAKTNYIHNVARFAMEKGMDFKHLDKLTNEEVINYLTEIKGVGRWTVEMLLMFTLGREDVFAVDDLGIQQAMISLYGIKTTDKKKLSARMKKISESWSPYRTYACMYLWRWKDGEF